MKYPVMVIYDDNPERHFLFMSLEEANQKFVIRNDVLTAQTVTALTLEHTQHVYNLYQSWGSDTTALVEIIKYFEGLKHEI